MNFKTVLLVMGWIAVAVAVADQATGNTNHPILPDAVGNHLDQQTDLLIGAVGAGALFYAYSQL